MDDLKTALKKWLHFRPTKPVPVDEPIVLHDPYLDGRETGEDDLFYFVSGMELGDNQ